MSDQQPPRQGIETLATLAYSELAAFERLATDAQFAPDVRDTVDLARMAGWCLAHFEDLDARITELGGDSVTLMEAARPSFAAFMERTKPTDWYESLMKGYVYDEILKDFARAALDQLDADSRAVATAVLDDTRPVEYLASRLGAAVAADQVLSSRLALWGRKLVAESLRRVRELPGVFPTELAAATELSQHIMSNHSRRMSVLGLTA